VGANRSGVVDKETLFSPVLGEEAVAVLAAEGGFGGVGVFAVDPDAGGVDGATGAIPDATIL
jgi:hypothetical protein